MKQRALDKFHELLERYVEVHDYESDGTIYSSEDQMTITDVSEYEDERCVVCGAWSPDCQPVLTQTSYAAVCQDCICDASVPCFRCGSLFVQGEVPLTVCPECAIDGRELSRPSE
jgi:hypothetical protein